MDAPTTVSTRGIGCHGGIGVAAAFAEQPTQNQRRDSGVDVARRAPGKIDHTHVAEETAASNPVCHPGIDDGEPEGHKHHHGRELHRLFERAHDQVRNDDGQRELEHLKDRRRDDPGQGVGLHAREKQRDKPDAAVQAAAIANREAMDAERLQHRDQTDDGETLHYHSRYVLGAHESCCY